MLEYIDSSVDISAFRGLNDLRNNLVSFITAEERSKHGMIDRFKDYSVLKKKF